ncbi:MAG TPA: hypothetical protein P5102_00375 [Candidatus Competibacteraceae bacterium]|nr:hypothetical protein [Candidatus Competibacteraceae bacterium]HRZ04606.1 hypothetical protein [Candidatus Competibacteraceae bacterium]HSA47144.1 hypothetical protein [Candidatus Competibacteraceae bacterium]
MECTESSALGDAHRVNCRLAAINPAAARSTSSSAVIISTESRTAPAARPALTPIAASTPLT